MFTFLFSLSQPLYTNISLLNYLLLFYLDSSLSHYHSPELGQWPLPIVKLHIHSYSSKHECNRLTPSCEEAPSLNS